MGSSPVTGVDGCHTGWAGVDCDEDGLIAVRVAPTLSDLLRGTPQIPALTGSPPAIASSALPRDRGSCPGRGKLVAGPWNAIAVWRG